MNEQIRRLALTSDRTGQLLGLGCECSREGCLKPIAATLAEYDAMRSDATHWLIAVGHAGENERVVVRTERYWIVTARGA